MEKHKGIDSKSPRLTKREGKGKRAKKMEKKRKKN